MIFKGVEVTLFKNAQKMAPLLAFLNNHWRHLNFDNSNRSAGLLLVGFKCGVLCFSWFTTVQRSNQTTTAPSWLITMGCDSDMQSCMSNHRVNVREFCSCLNGARRGPKNSVWGPNAAVGIQSRRIVPRHVVTPQNRWQRKTRAVQFTYDRYSYRYVSHGHRETRVCHRVVSFLYTVFGFRRKRSNERRVSRVGLANGEQSQSTIPIPSPRTTPRQKKLI
jgi:hypothetical protein